MGFTKEAIQRIKALHDAGYTCEEIAKKFGIKEIIVRSITNL